MSTRRRFFYLRLPRQLNLFGEQSSGLLDWWFDWATPVFFISEIGNKFWAFLSVFADKLYNSSRPHTLIGKRNMQKPQHHDLCWMLLLFGSLIATVMLAFSCWMFLPSEVHFWSIISRNYSGSDIIKFSMPPASVPEELKLMQRPPYIYQILH